MRGDFIKQETSSPLKGQGTGCLLGWYGMKQSVREYCKGEKRRKRIGEEILAN